METQLIHIDTLCRVCGFFNSETIVNSGYGCNNNECEDGSHVQFVKRTWYCDSGEDYTDGHFTSILARKMTTRKISCNKRLARKFLKKARLIEHDNSELKKYGFKWQGACYTFTCPLGNQADDQDFIEHGEDPEMMEEGAYLVIDNDTYNQFINNK